MFQETKYNSKMSKTFEVFEQELSSLRREISVATNALASRVLEQNKGLQEVMTKNTEQAVNIFAEKVAQSFEKRLNDLSKGIDAYQNQLIASLKEMNTSDGNNVVMKEISKSQNQLTKEIRSLYKKNEEIFNKIKSSDGLIKFP